MSSSSFPLPLKPPVSLHHHKHRALHKPSLSPSLSKSYVCFSSSLSNAPSPPPDDRQDILWLREEQRWLREEQRWLREERRWLRERESLLAEIQSLRLQIQALEKRISVQEMPETMANVRALLQVLTEKNRIGETGSGPSPIVLEEEVKEVVRVEVKERKTLRKGSEGEEVKEMQVRTR